MTDNIINAIIRGKIVQIPHTDRGIKLYLLRIIEDGRKMTSKERVKKAIKLQGPDRTPILIYNQDFDQSDIVVCNIIDHFQGEDRSSSEYGFVWERFDGTMGQPKDSVIHDLSELDDYKFPNAKVEGRFDLAFDRMKTYGDDKYYIGNLFLSGFTIMTFLYGFENTLCDLCLDEEGLEKLADGVFGFEEEVIREAAGKGFSAIGFFDDWGTQQQLMISGECWRRFFKPRYKKQFDLCHELGMDVFFHSCGYIHEIIGDLFEIGVDMLNVSQPNLFDMKKLGSEFGGKGCFVCPVSYQTTSLSGTREDIFHDVREMRDNIGCYNGGLIGYIEEYSVMGMSSDNYQACKDAFLEK